MVGATAYVGWFDPAVDVATVREYTMRSLSATGVREVDPNDGALEYTDAELQTRTPAKWWE
jgi:hypothetical protein